MNLIQVFRRLVRLGELLKQAVNGSYYCVGKTEVRQCALGRLPIKIEFLYLLCPKGGYALFLISTLRIGATAS
jgi:hypothetical protein